MKAFLILSAVVCACLGARLEGHQPAPFSALNSGGHGDFLQAPIQGSSAHHGSASGSGANVAILRNENVNNGDGTYHYAFETADGTKQEQQGELKDFNDGEEPSLSVSGSYSYTDPTGKVHTVTYTADKYGFHPVTTTQQKQAPSANSAYLPPSDQGYHY